MSNQIVFKVSGKQNKNKKTITTNLKKGMEAIVNKNKQKHSQHTQYARTCRL